MYTCLYIIHIYLYECIYKYMSNRRSLKNKKKKRVVEDLSVKSLM